MYFQRTYVRYIIRSNVYLFSARLCVLSAQHMNTRSYNVYAEKHMFDFYNKFLRIFVLIVNVCSTILVQNEQMCVRVNTYSWKFVQYMNVCSLDTWKQWNVYTFLNFSSFLKFSKTLIVNLFKSFLKLYLLYSIYLYTSIKPFFPPVSFPFARPFSTFLVPATNTCY